MLGLILYICIKLYFLMMTSMIFDHVENCLMKICHKNKKEAKKIALLAHKQGKAICYVSSLEECETVAEKLAEQGLTVAVH
jgi:ATP-dependent Clp protease adapter protein ClpS